MAVEKLRIDILDTSLTIETDEQVEYIESIVSYIKKKVTMIRNATLVTDPLKLAILSNIYIVDELFTAQKQVQQASQNADMEYIENAAERILHTIDSALNEPENLDKVE